MTIYSAWQKNQFTRALKSALEAIPELPECAHPILIAWSAFESGWGTTEQASQCCNYWNLSAGSQEHGRSNSWPEPKPVLIGLDKEPVKLPDGRIGWKELHQYWRVYATPEEGVEDCLRTLNWPRYQPARDALMAGQGDRFIDLLGPDRSHHVPPTGGWFTLSTPVYLLGYRAALAEVLATLGPDTASRIC